MRDERKRDDQPRKREDGWRREPPPPGGQRGGRRRRGHVAGGGGVLRCRLRENPPKNSGTEDRHGRIASAPYAYSQPVNNADAIAYEQDLLPQVLADLGFADLGEEWLWTDQGTDGDGDAWGSNSLPVKRLAS